MSLEHSHARWANRSPGSRQTRDVNTRREPLKVREGIVALRRSSERGDESPRTQTEPARLRRMSADARLAPERIRGCRDVLAGFAGNTRCPTGTAGGSQCDCAGVFARRISGRRQRRDTPRLNVRQSASRTLCRFPCDQTSIQGLNRRKRLATGGNRSTMSRPLHAWRSTSHHTTRVTPRARAR